MRRRRIEGRQDFRRRAALLSICNRRWGLRLVRSAFNFIFEDTVDNPAVKRAGVQVTAAVRPSSCERESGVIASTVESQNQIVAKGGANQRLDREVD
jgi:hypothetical protein